MPTYDYRCDACGHSFGRKQRFGEEPVATCPKCGARPRRLVSTPAIVFKGSGWHVTDYRRAGAGPEGDGDTRAKPSERGEHDVKAGAAPTDGAAPQDTTKKDTTKTDSTKKESAPAKESDATS